MNGSFLEKIIQKKAEKMKKKIFRWIGLLMLCVGAAWLGHFCAQDREEAPAAAHEPRIALSTHVEITYRYGYCGHEQRIVPEGQYLGMNREEFSKAEPNLFLKEFSAEKVSAERYYEQYCPEHRIVQLREGRLCVVSAESGSEELVVRRELGIKADEILQRYREPLRYGMVVTLGRTVEDIVETVCQ